MSPEPYPFVQSYRAWYIQEGFRLAVERARAEGKMVGVHALTPTECFLVALLQRPKANAPARTAAAAEFVRLALDNESETR